MTEPIRSMDELLRALRKRRDELNISHETIDSISGLQSGYTSKLLAPKPMKNLGPVSFGPLLTALGLAVKVVEDPEAVMAVSKRWEKRKRPQKAQASIEASMQASITCEVPATIEITAEIEGILHCPTFRNERARKGGHARKEKLSARKRRLIARHAARSRWAKRGEAEA